MVPSPHPIPGLVKTKTATRQLLKKQKHLFDDFHAFYQKYKNSYKIIPELSQNGLEMVPKWSPAPLPIPD